MTVGNNKRNNKKVNNVKGGGNLNDCYKVQGDGQSSNFSENMTTREFNCNQPNWNPKCT